MALSQEDIQNIQNIVNQVMNQNNQNLMNQVQSMVQQQTPAPPPVQTYVQPQTQPQVQVMPQYPPTPPAYPMGVNPYDPMQIAQAVNTAMQQQYGAMHQFGNMTMNDMMAFPQNVREAWLQNMVQPQMMSPEYQALNQKIDDLTDQLQWEQWKNTKHHSKRKTALKIGLGAVAVGGVAYGVHKFRHRHDSDRLDALTSLGNRYLDLKYGGDLGSGV